MIDHIRNHDNRFYLFFFFKQKTAYEIAQCLVGSEMCIRDRTTRVSTTGMRWLEQAEDNKEEGRE